MRTSFDEILDDVRKVVLGEMSVSDFDKKWRTILEDEHNVYFRVIRAGCLGFPQLFRECLCDDCPLRLKHYCHFVICPMLVQSDQHQKP